MTTITKIVPTLDVIHAVESECVAQIDGLRRSLESGEARPYAPANSLQDAREATAVVAIRRATDLLRLVDRYSDELPDAETCTLRYSVDAEGQIGSMLNVEGWSRYAMTAALLPPDARCRIVTAIVAGVAAPDNAFRLRDAHVALCLAAGAAHAKIVGCAL